MAAKTLGIVVGWRHGEDDLAATIDSAAASATKSAQVYAVEDKDMHGPARTRHRGIEAATDCDVIAIIDAHMRFSPRCLADMARHVRKTGDLACASVHHNAECSFDGGAYYGGRIVERAKDGKTQNALCVKWSKAKTHGDVGCVIGACYVFPRELYYAIGQPLSALAGWGCDEEALSISAWIAGRNIVCLPQTCAHKYRSRPPWQTEPKEFAAVHSSRLSMIEALVSDEHTRKELTRWQTEWVSEGVQSMMQHETDRWRASMSRMPRTFQQWREAICEPAEIDGVQQWFPQVIQEPLTTRRRIENKVTVMHGVRCPHCGQMHDPKQLKVVNSYTNGNRRHRCRVCARPFISMYREESAS